MNTQVLGISIDHIPCLQAWAESLGGIQYPLLSDFWPHGRVAELYGVLRSEGYSERAIFVIDRFGIIRYIDIHDIDTQPDNELLRKVLKSVDPDAAARYAEQKTTLAQASKKLEDQLPISAEILQGEIVMYCTKWCPECRRARAWMQEIGLTYVEVDVNSSPEAAAKVRSWANGNLVSPTFEIDGQVVVNFNRARLEEILRKRIAK